LIKTDIASSAAIFTFGLAALGGAVVALAAPASAETGSSSGSTSASGAAPSVDGDTSMTAPDGSTDSATADGVGSTPTAVLGNGRQPGDPGTTDSGTAVSDSSTPDAVVGNGRQPGDTTSAATSAPPRGVAITPRGDYAYATNPDPATMSASEAAPSTTSATASTDQELDAYYGPDGWVRYNGVVYDINDPEYMKAVQSPAEKQAQRVWRIELLERQTADARDAFQHAEYIFLSRLGGDADELNAAWAYWQDSKRQLDELRNAPL
jgi:hypothetical protein